MDFCKLKSKDNDTVKRIAQLQKSAKFRRENGFFVLEGLRLCEDAADNGFCPETVVVTSAFLSEFYDKATKIAGKAVKCYEVTEEIFKKISDTTNPQGILCVCRFPKWDGADILNNGKYIVLENLQDPSNLGAVSRTAEALGITAIVVDGGCDPYSPKSLRASMGALLRIPVLNIDNSCKIFKNNNVKTYAAVVNNKEALRLGEVNFNDGCAVFIGNEANGLTEKTIAECDYKITIPMSGRAESLNAAVASSIIMWEMCKC